MSVIGNFFSVEIFKIKFLSVFQELFTEIFWGAVVFFVRCFRNIFFNLDHLMMAL